MRSLRTIRCKITIPSDSVETINELFDLYAKAVSKIAKWGRDNRENNKFRLQAALYYKIREESKLTANLVITALRRASGMLQASQFKGRFDVRPVFVVFDSHTFNLKLKKGVVSFSTHKGRIEAALDIGIYQHEALWGADIAQSATLVRARDGYYCNIVVQSEIPEAAPGGVLGVDLGTRNIAAISSGIKFNGDSIRQYRETRWKVRASLASKGTKGARRVLRRLRGLEARRVASKNHWLAKRIVSEAIKAGCDRIAMEDLKGIRERTRVPSRHLNRMVSSWSFAQLQHFVEYKAAAKGIKTVYVDAAYTSQTCGECLKRGFRDKERFLCTTCGEADADVNAATVIAARGGGAGAEPADCNAPRIAGQIVEFFSHSVHAKAAKG